MRKDKDHVSHEEIIENDENSSDENVDHNNILGGIASSSPSMLCQLLKTLTTQNSEIYMHE